MGRLNEVDLSLSLSREEAERELRTAWERLAELRLTLGGLVGDEKLGPPLLVVFEGWDASGKGGSIKRLVAPLDPRHVRVVQFAAPTHDEKRHHFSSGASGQPCPVGAAWRCSIAPGTAGCWSSASRGLASREQWLRANDEINGFERSLIDEGTIESIEAGMRDWGHEPPPTR